MVFTYQLGSDDDAVVALSKVRLLLNDVDDETHVFEDDEVAAFLGLEGGNIKRAAAQAIDTNADDQALAGKVLRTQDLSTDGAKVADALRKRAAELRRQADEDDANGDDTAFFEIGPFGAQAGGPELTVDPVYAGPWWP